VRALLREVDVNGRAGDGATALHWAARWDDLKTAELLLEAGADVNAIDELGATPLWVACSEVGPSMVEILLKAGASPNAALMSGETPLMAAAHVGNVGVVRSLVEAGGDVNAVESGRQQTALMWAAAEGHSDVIEVLLKAGANVHARSAVRSLTVSLSHSLARIYDKNLIIEIPQGGYTALLFAALQGEIDTTRVLLEGGANVNDAAPVGTSALVLAAHSGHGALGAFLLQKGADPNAAGAGYAPLHAAILRRDVELVKALMKYGANPNAPILRATPARRNSADDYALTPEMVGATPIWLAARFGEHEMMTTLANAGADPKFVMTNGFTILMAPMSSPARGEGDQVPTYVVTEGMIFESVKTAAELGVELNAATTTGDTAMHLAVLKQLDSVVQFLADRGATLNVRNKKQQTPLALAVTRKAEKTADLLRQLGATE
jgi:ankyrin repeat protein